jgi:excisionase family DNA binding protein
MPDTAVQTDKAEIIEAGCMRSPTMSVNEAHERIGKKEISRTTVYEAIDRGELRSIRMGRRILILRNSFEEWLSGAQKRSTGEDTVNISLKNVCADLDLAAQRRLT